jgi:hypothetical protein
MNPEAERLYSLLPALYRIRDVEQGEPLKNLCAIIAEDVAVLREDLDQLYDDQFIETCAEWVAPYIGDLIGFRPIHGVSAHTVSARAEVANTIAYRRRKGTATVLEQLARDVTGWDARVVEFFQFLQTSQYMNHIRLENRVTADLRDWEALERRDTAFNRLAHSVDMRRVDTQNGRYNIPNIGVYLWRLPAFSLTQSPAFRLRPDDQRFLFSPLGNNMQLFTRPESETDITHLAEPINVPEPISRRVLHNDLDLAQHSDKENSLYYGKERSLVIEIDSMEVGIGDIHVCNLSDDGTTWAHLPASGEKIAIDPVLGRIAFPPDTVTTDVRVMFHHGFSMAMGGGEYERSRTFALGGGLMTVVQGQSLQAALTAAQGGGIIVEIGDSGRYEEALNITLPPTAKVEVRAANEHRPTLMLGGEWNIALAPGADLTLNGLLITGGRLHVTGTGGEGPGMLRLRHCTLVPGWTLTRNGEPDFPDEPSLVVEARGSTIEIDHCLVGGVRAEREVTVTIANSIVDATADDRVAYTAGSGNAAGGILSLINSTVIGRVHTSRLDLASNSIVVARSAAGPWRHSVVSDQNQSGCVRFCFLPSDSIVPRRYRCQPDLAVEAELLAADQPKGSLSIPQRKAITMATQARVRPVWTSLRYGQPGYCQLGSSCPNEIRMGAEDESEMGAFHDVFGPQREHNLRIRLQEYLRFGLEAGIFYST